MPDAASRNLAVVQRFYETFDRDGAEAALALFDELCDPRVEFSPLLAREVEGRRSYRGSDEIRAFLRELDDLLGGARYEPPEYQPVGDDVVVVFTRLVGTGRGSAVPIGQDLAIVYEFRDGLIQRFVAYGTREEALTAAEEITRAEA
ncbi:MAG: nuclear transport factor 2 family protein [Actinomycetota bacterium]